MPLAASSWLVCWIDCWSASICCSVLTSVNSAVCVRNCVLSVGDNGSWYFIWATSSFKNVFSVDLVVAVRATRRRCVVDVDVGVVGKVGGMAVIVCSWWSSQAYVEQRRGSGSSGGTRDPAAAGSSGGGAARRRSPGRSGSAPSRDPGSDAAVGHGEVTGAHTSRIEGSRRSLERVAHQLGRAFVLGVDRRTQHAVFHLDAHLDAAELRRLQLEPQRVGAVGRGAQRGEHRHQLLGRRRRGDGGRGRSAVVGVRRGGGRGRRRGGEGRRAGRRRRERRSGRGGGRKALARACR